MTRSIHGKLTRLNLSARYSSEKMLDYYWRVIHEYQPTFIQGFPSILTNLCNYALKNKLETFIPALTYIETRSENLLPSQKQVIESVFRKPVANHYGSKELWTIAYSCNVGNLHLLSESVNVEVVDVENKQPCDENEGELLITSKILTEMPLIRYSIGDIGKKLVSDCICGSKVPILNINGRHADDVITINGVQNRMVLSPIWELLRNEKAISQVQIEQVSINAFIIRCTGSEINISLLTQLCSSILSRVLQQPVNVVIETIKQFRVESNSGKFKSFIPLSEMRRDDYVETI